MSEVRRDRWGRYVLPDPVTGEERAWTRATTIANTLSDPWGLVDWKMRMVAKGVATRDDLRALASALPLDSGKKQLNMVARDAIEAAGGSSGRNLGTAMHEFTAQVDRGEEPEVPYNLHPDLYAYRAALALHGVRIVPGLVERIVCIPDLGVAGTFDRIVVWDPHSYIADVKTGTDLAYSWLEIAVQEALYANAEWLWDPEAETWGRMPTVALDRGLVMHLPVGQGRCDLYWVDLEIGWEAVTLAVDVREWRKRKDISRPFGVDLLGRSPVQPVLDLAGERTQDPSPVQPEVAPPGSPVKDSPADETMGEDSDRRALARQSVPLSFPAGESDA